jgi:hypothetical protein
MSISSAGVISWPQPAAGSPAVSVTAKDNKSGLSGKGVITFKIEAVPLAPLVSDATASGMGGVALSVTLKVVATNGATWTLRDAPAGMSVSAAGVISWPKPVQGSYKVIAVATDKQNGLSGQGTISLSIEPVPVPPVVQPARLDGVAGKPMYGTLVFNASHALNWTLAGAPAGLTISSSGVLSWPDPTPGNWSVTATAKDVQTGLSGKNSVAVHVEAVPTLTGATLNGKEASPLSFSALAKAGHAVTYALSGAPDGMVISAAGLVSWAAPVPGNWSVTVKASDIVNGLSGSAIWTVKIVAVPLPPLINAPALTGKVGTPLSGSIQVRDPKSTGLSISITGLPWGMRVDTGAMSASSPAPTFPLSWATPVAGQYSVKIVAKNAAGLSTTVTMPVTIAAR